MSKKIKEGPPERWRPSFLLTTHQIKNTSNRWVVHVVSHPPVKPPLSPSLSLCGNLWPLASCRSGGFVFVAGVPALQLSPGAFHRPALALWFWVWGVSEASDLLPLFNKKQIRFAKRPKNALAARAVTGFLT